MPTSPASTDNVLFYREGGRKQDASLHEEILAGGDHAAALDVSREVAQRLGLTRDEIEALLGNHVLSDFNPYHQPGGSPMPRTVDDLSDYAADVAAGFDRHERLVRARLRDKAREVYDYNTQHRPAGPGGGQFAPKSGGGAGGGAETKPFKGFKPGLKISGGAEEIKPLKQEWLDKSPIKGKSMDEVLAHGEKAQQLLGHVLRQVSGKMGIDFGDPGHKTNKQRIQQKADERGGLHKVSDIFRGSFYVDHPDQADEAVKHVAKHFEVINEDWRITPQNYGDKALQIRHPNGMVGELQIVEKNMAHAKKEKAKGGLGGHEAYEESRHPDTPPARKEELERHQIKLYGGVLRKYGDHWKKAYGPKEWAKVKSA